MLEHLEGPRLSTLIERYGPLTADQAVPLGVELAAALHYLEGERVVHLDLKPANVIMGAPPRLIDFSLARSVEAAAELDRAVGTAPHMAPSGPSRASNLPGAGRPRKRFRDGLS